MKKAIILILPAILMLASCRKTRDTTTASPDDYIPVDSANKMLSSYLLSINSATNDSAVRSWSIDVDQLRLLLDSPTAGHSVKHLKIMLSHNLDYINSGHANMLAGYNKNALTVIVAGYDDLGNYIFLGNNAVLNRARPCPSNCPPGDAGNYLLTD